MLPFMKITCNIKALETVEGFWDFFPPLNDIYSPGTPGGRTQVVAVRRSAGIRPERLHRPNMGGAKEKTRNFLVSYDNTGR